MKARWLTELESGLAELAEEVKRRREVSTIDPVADGITFAMKTMKLRVDAVTAPGVELTPAEWGASQDPPVVEQTVRNWIKAGELDARETAHGYRILASTDRVRRVKGAA
jgi:hypothetical protein